MPVEPVGGDDAVEVRERRDVVVPVTISSMIKLER